MGEQLVMFSPRVEEANDRLNRSLAEMRLQQRRREETRPRAPTIHRTVRATRCPSCGAHVTIPV